MAGIAESLTGVETQVSQINKLLTNAEIDALVDKFNPYPTIRDVQRSAIHQIIDAFQAGETLLECPMPTASGKTLVLTIVSKILNEVFKLDMVLTTTPLVALADQYAANKLYADVPTLIGKANYPCAFDAKLSAADCPFSRTMKKKPAVCAKCEYREAKEAFDNSPIGYTTFDRYHYDPSINGRVNVLLIDESASIEKKLREYNTLEMPMFIDEENKVPLTNNNIKEWLERHYNDLEESISGKEALFEEVAMKYQQTQNIDEIELYRNQMKSLNREIQSLESEKYSTGKAISYIKKGVRFIITVDSVDKYDRKTKQYYPTQVKHFKLLTAEVPFEEMTHNLRFVVLASGTPATQMLTDKPFNKISVEHPIPVSDRPAKFFPVGSMSYSSRDTTAVKMAGVIAQLFNKEPNNVIVHCGSYPVAQLLYKNLVKHVDPSLIILQTKKTRREALNRFLNAEHMVYLSVEMLEGVDLVGEKFKVNVIAKRPTALWKDPYTEARNAHDTAKYGYNMWYECNSANAMMQAYGRTTRKPGDESTTYFLDSACLSFWKRYNTYARGKVHLFYDWFDEACVIL